MSQTTMPASAARPAPQQSWRTRAVTHPVVVSIAVGVVGGLISFWLRTLPIASDPVSYVQAGIAFPKATWNMVGLTRYGIVLPLSVIGRVFHQSEATFYLMPLAATVVMLSAAHWLARRYFGALAAFATVAALLACSPILINSTRLYPDIFSASTTTLAMACAVASRDAARANAPRGRVALLMVVTGLVVGASWWMRETSVFVWPVIALLLLRNGRSYRRQVIVYAGGAALAMFIGELVISEVAFGDALARVHALTGSDMASTTNPQDLPYLNQSPLAYLLTVPRVMLSQPDGPILVAEAMLTLLGGIFFARVRLFAAWFVCTALLLIAAGGALRPSDPSLRLDLVRYWLPFLVPMVIGAVGTVSTVLEGAVSGVGASWRRTQVRSRFGALIAAATLVFVAAYPTGNYVRHDPEFDVTNHGVVNEFGAWIVQHHKIKSLWADVATARQLPVFLHTFWGRPISNVKVHTYMPDAPPHPGAYVLLFSDGQRTCGFCNEWIAELRAAHPDAIASWTPVWESPDGAFQVYRVPKATSAAQ